MNWILLYINWYFICKLIVMINKFTIPTRACSMIAIAWRVGVLLYAKRRETQFCHLLASVLPINLSTLPDAIIFPTPIHACRFHLGKTVRLNTNTFIFKFTWCCIWYHIWHLTSDKVFIFLLNLTTEDSRVDLISKTPWCDLPACTAEWITTIS